MAVAIEGNSPITLGDFAFSFFEVPEMVRYAGRQQLVVHKQPGGARQIDVLGQDDDDIIWEGTFLSSDALDRAATLDAMRVSGDVYALAFGAIERDVVISHLELFMRAPNMVDYRISCTPLQNAEAAVAPLGAADVQGFLNNAIGALG